MNIIDTRDLAKRLDELTELRDAVTEAEEALQEALETCAEMQDALDSAEPDEEEDAEIAMEEAKEARDDAQAELDSAKEAFSEEEQAELAELEEIESCVSDFRHGECLIEEDDFVAYCEQLVDDIGDLPRDLPSYIVIDWEGTAYNLRADYSEVEYQGTTYLARS